MLGATVNPNAAAPTIRSNGPNITVDSAPALKRAGPAVAVRSAKVDSKTLDANEAVARGTIPRNHRSARHRRGERVCHESATLAQQRRAGPQRLHCNLDRIVRYAAAVRTRTNFPRGASTRCDGITEFTMAAMTL